MTRGARVLWSVSLKAKLCFSFECRSKRTHRLTVFTLFEQSQSQGTGGKGVTGVGGEWRDWDCADRWPL